MKLVAAAALLIASAACQVDRGPAIAGVAAEPFAIVRLLPDVDSVRAAVREECERFAADSSQVAASGRALMDSAGVLFKRGTRESRSQWDALMYNARIAPSRMAPVSQRALTRMDSLTAALSAMETLSDSLAHFRFVRVPEGDFFVVVDRESLRQGWEAVLVEGGEVTVFGGDSVGAAGLSPWGACGPPIRNSR